MGTVEPFRQAGQLSSAREGRTLNLADLPHIHITDARDKTRLTRKLDSELVKELENILFKCGYVGSFKLIPMGLVKGTPHTKGLHFKECRENGVVAHLHGRGGNDTNVEAILIKPPAFDAYQFFSALKLAQRELEKDQERKQGSSDENGRGGGYFDVCIPAEGRTIASC